MLIISPYTDMNVDKELIEAIAKLLYEALDRQPEDGKKHMAHMGDYEAGVALIDGWVDFRALAQAVLENIGGLVAQQKPSA